MFLMTVPPSWFFAVLGSVLAVGSAIAAGGITLYLERREKAIERKIAETKEIVQFKQRHFEASTHYTFAQLKLWLAQFAAAQAPGYGQALASQFFEQASSAVLTAITLRNEAAGYRLTRDDIQTLTADVIPRASVGGCLSFR
jgi:hypothetical protein